MQRVVYCRHCEARTAHAEDRSWAARWQCLTCKRRSFDDELEVAHGLHLLRSTKEEGGAVDRRYKEISNDEEV